MSKYIRQITCLFILLTIVPALSGCGTIYGAAVDERNIRTIAADTAIKSKILSRFADNEEVDVLDFAVSSYHGHVYLIGEYDTEAQKDTALRLARATEGVKHVTTHLVRSSDKPGCGLKENLATTAKVKAKLIADKSIWSTNIDVKTIQCHVILWGLVGSQAEIAKAIAHAKSVPGVQAVKSYLRAAK